MTTGITESQEHKPACDPIANYDAAMRPFKNASFDVTVATLVFCFRLCSAKGDFSQRRNETC